MIDIRNVLVVGAGTMGHSIAQVFAQAGYSVHLVDTHVAILERAKKQIRSNLAVMVEAGVFEAQEIDGTVDRIVTSTDLEQSAKHVELAIECVPEEEGAKRDTLSRMDKVCSSHAILASNTSALDIFKIATVSRAERLCITHWYAPPHIIPLVDVVKGPQTSQETCDLVVELLHRLGKKPMCLKRFVPGYLATRFQIAMARELNYLLDNGIATPEEVDEAIKASLAPRMMALGIARRMDFTGLDVCLSVEKAAAERPLPRASARTLTKLVNEGHLGVKTGKGFYDYGGKTSEQILRERDLALFRVLRVLS